MTLRSLYSAVSGLQSHQTQMDVIGNNISNVNTIGYKSSRVTFTDVFSQTVRGAFPSQGNTGGINPAQVGLGSRVGSIDTVFTQGNFQTTGRTFDLSVEGNGFFALADTDQSSKQVFFTRAGNFDIDSRGFLVNPSNGFFVQGVIADENGSLEQSGTVSSQAVKVDLNAVSKPTVTQNVIVGGNLDSNAEPSAASGLTSLRALFDATGQVSNANGEVVNLRTGDIIQFATGKVASAAAGTIGLSDLVGDDGEINQLVATDKIRIASGTIGVIQSAGGTVALNDYVDSTGQDNILQSGLVIKIASGAIGGSSIAGTEVVTIADSTTTSGLASALQTVFTTASGDSETVVVNPDGTFTITRDGSDITDLTFRVEDSNGVVQQSATTLINQVLNDGDGDIDVLAANPAIQTTNSFQYRPETSLAAEPITSAAGTTLADLANSSGDVGIFQDGYTLEFASGTLATLDLTAVAAIPLTAATTLPALATAIESALNGVSVGNTVTANDDGTVTIVTGADDDIVDLSFVVKDASTATVADATSIINDVFDDGDGDFDMAAATTVTTTGTFNVPREVLTVGANDTLQTLVTALQSELQGAAFAAGDETVTINADGTLKFSTVSSNIENLKLEVVNASDVLQAGKTTFLSSLFTDGGTDNDLDVATAATVDTSKRFQQVAADLAEVTVMTVEAGSTLQDLSVSLRDTINTNSTGDESVVINSDGTLRFATGENALLGVTMEVVDEAGVAGTVQTPQTDFLNSIMTGTGCNNAIRVDANSQADTTNYFRQADATSSIDVFDSLGNARTVTIAYVKDTTQNNVFNWHVVAPYLDINSDEGSEPNGDSGSITFQSDGQIDEGKTGTFPSLTFDPDGSDEENGAAESLQINLDMSGVTQFASDSTAVFESQDGSPQGNLDSISIDSKGIIRGLFTNGETRDLAQVLIAAVPNEEGLTKVGDSMFSTTPAAGEAILSKATEGGRGSIVSGTLELSNVDLSKEFANMIVNQRGFQANARVITTADELLNELVNII